MAVKGVREEETLKPYQMFPIRNSTLSSISCVKRERLRLEPAGIRQKTIFVINDALKQIDGLFFFVLFSCTWALANAFKKSFKLSVQLKVTECNKNVKDIKSEEIE